MVKVLFTSLLEEKKIADKINGFLELWKMQYTSTNFKKLIISEILATNPGSCQSFCDYL